MDSAAITGIERGNLLSRPSLIIILASALMLMRKEDIFVDNHEVENSYYMYYLQAIHSCCLGVNLPVPRFIINAINVSDVSLS